MANIIHFIKLMPTIIQMLRTFGAKPGEGKKFVESSRSEDTLQPSDQLREFVRRECREIINEMLSIQNEHAQSKTVVLSAEKIKAEKVMDEAATFSEKQ